MTLGTPKTLREAIQNGIEDGIRQLAGTTRPAPKAADVIERHVLDFMRQKFAALYLEFDDVLDTRALRKLRWLARAIGIERESQ